ncbi:class I SAM-dependent methyltransferase [Patescibacteria group bacterium]|nr:class I SAM-dependent methyltransferase [Patescibacteria group bacterium]
MNKDKNNQAVWDKLSKQYFNNFAGSDEIEPEAAENLYFAWPVMEKFIKENVKDMDGQRALDFGCGAGEVCEKLAAMGLATTGVDYSEGMIDAARKNVGDTVDLHLGDSKKVLEIAAKDGKFNVIVSVLVFPFIEEIESVMRDLQQSLNEGGLLCFAVFNEEWVRRALENNIDYEQPEDSQGISKLILNFRENRRVEIFHRSKKEYDNILEGLGFARLLEEYPLFPEEFISKVYPGMPADISEYIILGYKKT